MCQYCENLTAQKVYGDVDGKDKNVYCGENIAKIDFLDWWHKDTYTAAFVAISEPNNLILGRDSLEYGMYIEQQKIHYCPMCGRKLN